MYKLMIIKKKNIIKPNGNFTRLQRAGALCHFSQSMSSYTNKLRKVFSYIKTTTYINSGVITHQFRIHISPKKLFTTFIDALFIMPKC